MKRGGGDRAELGCVQRISASAPEIEPVWQPTSRLVVRVRARRWASASRSPPSSARRRTRDVAQRVVEGLQLRLAEAPWPDTSRRRRPAAGPRRRRRRRWAPATAEADRGGDEALPRRRARSAGRTRARRSATAGPSASSSATSSSRIANSSPPKRATTSPGRSAPARRIATAYQQLVARAVAERVVDDLEVVDVDEEDRRGRRRGSWRDGPAPRLRRARQRARLGRPVSGSWVARCARLGAGAGGPPAGQLVGAPADDVDAGQATDERGVDRRPAPRVTGGVGVGAVDRRRVQRAHDPVVDEHVGDRQAPRDPVLIEREQRHDDEEVEVGLGDAAPQVGEHRRAGDQAQRAERRAAAAAEGVLAGAHRAEQDRQRVEQAVRELVAAGQREGRQRDDVQPQQHDHRPVACLERGIGQRAAGGQPAARPGPSAVRVQQHDPEIGRNAPNFGSTVVPGASLILA